MAETRFTVDPAALTELAKNLTHTSTWLDVARVAVENEDPQELGGQDAYNAVHDFVAHWKFQSDRIVKSLDELSRILRLAASQYQEVEDAQLKAQGSQK